jgi:hypothetical protein
VADVAADVVYIEAAAVDVVDGEGESLDEVGRRISVR